MTKVYAIISQYASGPDIDIDPIAYFNRDMAIDYLAQLCQKYNEWDKKFTSPEYVHRTYLLDKKNGVIYYEYLNSLKKVSHIEETWIKELEVE